MKRLGVLLGLCLLWAIPLGAQSTQGPITISAQDAGGTCATLNACAEFSFGGTVSLGIDVGGTFTGTLTFETSIDGSTWRTQTVTNATTLATATTTTAPGSFTLPNVGFRYIRLRATAFSSGSASVRSRQGYAKFEGGGGGGGGAGSFTSLTVTGNTTSGRFLAQDGTVPAPSYGFANFPGTGMYRSGIDALRIVTDNSTRIEFGSGTLIGGGSGLYHLLVNNGLVQVSGAPFRVDNGTAAVPTYSFTNDPTTGFYGGVGGVLRVSCGGSANCAVFTAAAAGVSGDFNAATFSMNSKFTSIAPPTATTFCTSPSIPVSNGTIAFTLNVGTGCATSTGVITLPAATTGWVVTCFNVTTPAGNVIGQTGGTTTTATITNYARTTGVAANWTDNDVLRCTGLAY